MKYFKSHSEFLNEAKLSAIHKAAKKGSYPVSIVVINSGMVVKQELVDTPAAVPAVFNELQKQFWLFEPFSGLTQNNRLIKLLKT